MTFTPTHTQVSDFFIGIHVPGGRFAVYYPEDARDKIPILEETIPSSALWYDKCAIPAVLLAVYRILFYDDFEVWK